PLADVGLQIGQGGQGVVIGDEIKTLALVLQRNVLLDGAEVVAEVKFAGRLHPAEDAFAGGGWFGHGKRPFRIAKIRSRRYLYPTRCAGQRFTPASRALGEPSRVNGRILESEKMVMDDRPNEVLITALKQALAEPGERRLFRSGKLAGLFANKSG